LKSSDRVGLWAANIIAASSSIKERDRVGEGLERNAEIATSNDDFKSRSNLLAVDISCDTRLCQLDAKVDEHRTVSLRLPDRDSKLVVVNVSLLLGVPFFRITS
jgi:hypothetical protein